MDVPQGQLPDLDDAAAALREAERARQTADSALEGLRDAALRSGERLVRSREERRAAVEEVVDSATPPRQVRSPEERRAAVERAIEESVRERRRRTRAAQERHARASRPVPEPEPRQATSPAGTPTRDRHDTGNSEHTGNTADTGDSGDSEHTGNTGDTRDAESANGTGSTRGTGGARGGATVVSRRPREVRSEAQRMEDARRATEEAMARHKQERLEEIERRLAAKRSDEAPGDRRSA